MTLDRLIDKTGKPNAKRTAEFYEAALENNDPSLFKAVYNKTRVFPFNFLERIECKCNRIHKHQESFRSLYKDLLTEKLKSLY